jgi:hypothetical protein
MPRTGFHGKHGRKAPGEEARRDLVRGRQKGGRSRRRPFCPSACPVRPAWGPGSPRETVARSCWLLRWPGLLCKPWVRRSASARLWVREWSEVIQECKQRLHFCRDRLDYQSTDEHALEYLVRKHANAIPTVCDGDRGAPVRLR